MYGKNFMVKIPYCCKVCMMVSFLTVALAVLLHRICIHINHGSSVNNIEKEHGV